MKVETLLLLTATFVHFINAQNLFDRIGDRFDNAVEDFNNQVTESVNDFGNELRNGVEEAGESIQNRVEDVESGLNILGGLGEGNEGSNQDIAGGISQYGSGGSFLSVVQSLQSNSLLQGFFGSFRTVENQILFARGSIPSNARETPLVAELFNYINTSRACNECQDFIEDLKDLTDERISRYFISRAVIEFCSQFQNATVCSEGIPRIQDLLFQVINNDTVTPRQICEGFLLCQRQRQDFTSQYVEEVLTDKPPTNIPNVTRMSNYTILHLTDIHIDFQYQEGSNAFCNQPLCCRAVNGAPADPSQAAGFWGSLSDCDLPARTFEQFLQQVSQESQIDLIVWTGDNVAHDIWIQNQENQTVPTQYITQQILQYFPNTPVYPMFGNHEIYPLDQYDFERNTTTWLQERLGSVWDVWLDDQALSSFREKTYYSMVNTQHNIKIIALNTQTCDSFNLYLLLDPTDPYYQLDWLREELYDSENNNQTVLIIGHIPPGHYNCHSDWSERYRALVDRFTNIISGQFFGHSHNDEIEIVRSYSDDSPVGVVFITPSLTTYSDLNPSFRVFVYDNDTNRPINYYQYRLDLARWNQNTTGPIQWDLSYDLLSEYNMTDMSYQSFDQMVTEIGNNTSVAERYASNFVAGGTPMNNITEIETKHFYCKARNSVFEDALQCLGLDASVADLFAYGAQLLPGQWYFANDY